VVRFLALAALAFNAWMMIDAYRRRAESYWLWIILGVPGGSLAYFFMVKLKDREMKQLGRRVLASLERPPSPEVLRRRYEVSPSFANRLALAQGLGDAGRWVEAKSHFQALLESRPGDPDALYGLGVCELELGNPEAAALRLSEIVDTAPSYREYAAWPELAEALGRLGRGAEALELMRELVERAPWLAHQILLARQLDRAGASTEAVELLERALREYDESPRHVRRQNRALAREARRLLAEIAPRVAA
jgi:hypothetical protein